MPHQVSHFSTPQARLGWQLHDGRRFGRHETLDAFSGVRIHHQFVKQRYRTDAGVNKEGWTLQINGSAFAGTAHAPAADAPARNISVIWCVAGTININLNQARQYIDSTDSD